jgi:unspecific monooxygenase
VSGADLAAELNDDSRFSKDGRNLGPLRRIVGDGLFTAENDAPNWQLAHDILMPAFTREAMCGYHPIMLEVARELLARWDIAADHGRPVDVTGDMTRVTLETIGRAGFGYRFGAFQRDQPHPFVTAMNRALRYANVAWLVLVAPNLSGLCPSASSGHRDNGAVRR